MVILNKAHPQVKVVRAVSECWNSLGGIGDTKKSGCKMPKKKEKRKKDNLFRWISIMLHGQSARS